jgi:hypothetical protein
MGIPPTGKQVSFPGILISRLVNGKIPEDRSLFRIAIGKIAAETLIFGQLGRLKQIGVIPVSQWAEIHRAHIHERLLQVARCYQ